MSDDDKVTLDHPVNDVARGFHDDHGYWVCPSRYRQRGGTQGTTFSHGGRLSGACIVEDPVVQFGCGCVIEGVTYTCGHPRMADGIHCDWCPPALRKDPR